MKKGEHLGALPAIKRLWPTLYAEEVGKATGKTGKADRFVVSTHTMALAGNLERLHEKTGEGEHEIDKFIKGEDRAPALPRKLAGLRGHKAARIPAVLDRLREQDDSEDELQTFEGILKNILGHKPETYYALLLFDGDHMGRILSGEHKDCAITYRQSFHPAVREGFDKRAQDEAQIREYGNLERAISPNRHFAISAALNDFALHIVPQIVECEYRGRVIYAGGDDVLAMLPVADLLPAMQRLREAYSGESSGGKQSKLKFKKGFALLSGTSKTPQRLMRMMGASATASCGAVIAHHQAPLGAVLRELRQTEKRAKNEGRRNAFSLNIMKRSGGALSVTSKWNWKGGNSNGEKPIDVPGVLHRLRRFLAEKSVSRRAVYNSLVWLRDLPDNADFVMLEELLYYQIARQTAKKTVRDYHDLPGLVSAVAGLALAERESPDWRKWLEDFLGVAEFLAREVRAPEVNESVSEGSSRKAEMPDADHANNRENQ